MPFLSIDIIVIIYMAVLFFFIAAFLTYFRSLKDTLKRKRRSGVVDHNTVCRRQGREREVGELFFLS